MTKQEMNRTLTIDNLFDTLTTIVDSGEAPAHLKRWVDSRRLKPTPLLENKHYVLGNLIPIQMFLSLLSKHTNIKYIDIDVMDIFLQSRGPKADKTAKASRKEDASKVASTTTVEKPKGDAKVAK